MAGKRKKFKAEVQQLLDIVIHSLYTHRDIFLRELISNASDAVDRTRFASLSDKSILGDNEDWKIKLTPDKEAKTLTISDNGIGMSREDLETNIGTIARSGTRGFLEALKESKDAGAPELIGEFGVGFYSAFMVADKVTVITKPATGEDRTATRWESKGAGSYTVDEADKEARGTDVILHLNEECEEYLEEWKLRKIVKQYSDFVEHPVCMDVERSEKPKDEEGNEQEDAEPETVVQEETLNSRVALWCKPKNEITEDEHREFYRHISHDFTEPFETIHWTVEGTTEFTALLYLPKQAPFDLFMPEPRKSGIQLYIKRVFITDECDFLVPTYLRFLHGVVDASDLPLNVSRETLQENRTTRVIQKNLVKKVLDTLGDIQSKRRDEYVEFWNQFGRILKEGVHLDFENRDKLTDLMLFESDMNKPGEMVSLEEYLNRMPEEQKEIYYISGDNRNALENSPHLEAFRKKGFDVLYMTDPIDDWVVQSVQTYKEKTLKSIAKGDVDLDTEEEKQEHEEQRKKSEETYKSLVEKLKSELDEKVKDIRLSKRLTDSACCLVADEASMGMHMERIMKAMQENVPPSKRILEVNPDHPLLKSMNQLCEQTSGDHEKFGEYAQMLYDQALLTAGLPVEDPLAFSRRVSSLMAREVETLGGDA